MAVDHDIAEYLEDQGIGTVGTDIFRGGNPPKVVNVTILTAYAGRPQDKSCAVEYPHLQVMVRNSVYSTGYDLSMTIKDELQRLGETTIEVVRYLAIYSLQSAPSYLGKDEGGNHIFTINYEIFKEVG